MGEALRRFRGLLDEPPFQAAYGSISMAATRPFADGCVVIGWTCVPVPSGAGPSTLASLGGGYCLIQVGPDGLTVARGSSVSPSIYVRDEGDIIVVSTRFGALARAGGALDVGKLSALVTSRASGDDERTVLRGVHRVPGYTALRFRDGQRETIAGLRPSLSEIDGTPDELAERFTDVVSRAVVRAMAGHRRVAVMVGGIDSSIVLAHAHRVLSDVVPVTVDFACAGDDRPHVAALCGHLGLEPVRVAPRACARFAQPCMVVDGAPCVHMGTAIQAALLVAAGEAGATVLLSGTGGDEVLGGTDPTVALVDALRHGDAGAVLRVLGAAMPYRRSPHMWLRGLAGHVGRPFQPAWLRDRRRSGAARAWLPWGGEASRDEQRRAIARAHVCQARVSSPAARYEALERHPEWLEMADQRDLVNACFDVPRVDPLLDDEVVRFMASLRPAALYHGGLHRGLARYATRLDLPGSVRFRADKATFEPVLAALAAPISQFDDLARLSRLADLGIVEPAKFRAAYATVRNAPTSSAAGVLWGRVWAALATERYLRAAP